MQIKFPLGAVLALNVQLADVRNAPRLNVRRYGLYTDRETPGERFGSIFNKFTAQTETTTTPTTTLAPITPPPSPPPPVPTPGTSPPSPPSGPAVTTPPTAPSGAPTTPTPTATVTARQLNDSSKRKSNQYLLESEEIDLLDSNTNDKKNGKNLGKIWENKQI